MQAATVRDVANLGIRHPKFTEAYPSPGVAYSCKWA